MENNIDSNLYFKKPDSMGDYSFTQYIHEFSISHDGIAYMTCYHESFGEVKTRVTAEQIKEEYVPVFEFFETAEYIGKEAYTENSVLLGENAIDNSFIDFHPNRKKENEQLILLYQTADFMIVYYQTRLNVIFEQYNKNHSRLHILDNRYVEADWITYGEPILMYQNPEELVEELEMLDHPIDQRKLC